MEDKSEVSRQKNYSTRSLQDIRRRAEREVWEKSELFAENNELTPPDDIQRILYELRVHQIELEMQNEELRCAQVELDASRSRYFDLYDLAPVGYLTFSEKGLILETNLAAANLLRVPRSAMKRRAISQFILGEDQDVFYLKRKRLFETSKSQECDLRMVKKDGTIFWVHINAAAAKDTDGSMVCRLVLSDLTESMQALIVKESEKRYKFLFEYSGVAIGYYKADGTLISHNKKAMENMDGHPEDCAGKSIYELFPKPYSDLYMSRIATALSCDSSQEYEDPLPLSTGTRWIYSIYNRIMDSDGKIAGIQIISQDITNRKNREQELVEAREDAIAADAAKSQFMANMSHEIRTPLHSIIGNNQLLELTELTEEQKEYVHISKMSSDGLLAVINDILDYSKIAAGKMRLEKTPFSLEKLLGELAGLFQLFAAEKGLLIRSCTGCDVPDSLIGDSFRLRQILSNLIGNAVKYTEYGEIDVSVRRIVHPDPEKIKLEFVVKDTGPGIPPEKTDVLFKCFSQVDNSNTRQYGGTGLGLSICKGLVEQMNGEIWMESNVGKGCCFYFTSVFEKSAVKHAAKLPSEGTQLENSKEKVLSILLVEDQSESRMIAEKYMQKKRWRFTAAENGKEAVDIFKKMKFDVILMDLQMPVLDGYAATRIIRRMETGHTTPIIAMTANALKEDKERCTEAGMDDFLAKPFDMNAFYSIIQKWTNKKCRV